MIKMMATICRRPGMTHAEYLAYVQQLPEFNPMLGYFGGSDVFYECVASLRFDDPASVGAFRAYERAQLRINADPRTAFCQPSQSFSLYATEVPIYDRH
jgi:hypothetical protein